jgi:signal transduction histidine kinase
MLGIVEAHGGEIYAEATARKGRSFTFSLPMEEEDERKKVDLVIDDDKYSRTSSSCR